MRRALLFPVLIASIILLPGSIDPGNDTDNVSRDNGHSVNSDTITLWTEQDDNLTIEFDDPTFEVDANQFSLPLNLSNVEGLSWIKTFYKMNSTEEEFLKQHGYVNLGDSGIYDIIDLYDWISDGRHPAYITVDSMLHVYHVLFDELLKDIEENHLYDNIYNFTGSVLTEAITAANSLIGTFNVSHFYRTLVGNSNVTYLINESLDLKKIAVKNVIYLSIARKLLDPYSAIPSWVKSEVNAELDLIKSHNGVFRSPLMDKHDIHPILEYYEDYTQYAPRGHYTKSQRLQNYFRAVMWLGRMTFRQKSAEETIQAILLSDSISKAKFGNGSASDLWNETYKITSFFVGWSDDLTYNDYLTLSNVIYGNISSQNTKIKNPSRLVLFMDYLDELRKPKINSHFYDPLLEAKENATLGMRLMGQRIAPDSYMFQELVYPKVGNHTGTGMPFTLSKNQILENIRGFPRGMDAMAVLGNEMAETYLIQGGDTNYVNYTSQFARLRSEFNGFDNDTWGSNLYWGWLHTLRSLNENFTAKQYPTFMKDNGYLAEKLNTALGSWTQLRHDTILYAKQSHTGGVSGTDPKGYVEPIPAFYSRLRALSNATREGLDHLNVLGMTMKNNLLNLSNTLFRLEDISIKQLENKTISSNDYIFIDHFDDRIANILRYVPRDAGDSRMIVDVHTDYNMDPSDMVWNKCLEEAVGNFDHIVVIRNDSDGKLRAAIGPVFSYYEFKKPISQRMTDDDWKTALGTGNYEVHKFNWSDYPEHTQKIVKNVPAYSDLSISHEDIELEYTEDPWDLFNMKARIRVNNNADTDTEVKISTFIGTTEEKDLRKTFNINIRANSRSMITDNWTVKDQVDLVEKLFVKLDAEPEDDMNDNNNMAMKFIELVGDNDYDDDGILNIDDAFPFDPAASIDTDVDGYPDVWNPGKGPDDSTLGLSLDAFPEDPLEWSDTDGDGIGDNSDIFPLNPYEWADMDLDGIGDYSDDFPEDHSASIDSDGDGYPDQWNPGKGPDDSTSGLSLDAYPEDPSEWSDTDGDGFGDNSDMFPLDPDEWSDMDHDRIGDNSDDFPEDHSASIDSDGDGYPDLWNPGKGPADSILGLSLDSFPEDPTEWSDLDGDGFGDNMDQFPNYPSEWNDTDGDGYGDNSDMFPNNASAWIDSDKDGYDDNIDEYPHNPNEWIDSDGDTVGDNSDKFPLNPNEWTDIDGDGIGDFGDAFPEDPAASIDTDGDGYPDRWNEGMNEKDSNTGLKLDHFPNDNSRFEEPKDKENYLIWVMIGSVALIIIILSLSGIIYRTRSNNASKRILRYKRTTVRGKEPGSGTLADEEIQMEIEKRKGEGTISMDVYEDIIQELDLPVGKDAK